MEPPWLTPDSTRAWAPWSSARAMKSRASLGSTAPGSGGCRGSRAANRGRRPGQARLGAALAAGAATWRVALRSSNARAQLVGQVRRRKRVRGPDSKKLEPKRFIGLMLLFYGHLEL